MRSDCNDRVKAAQSHRRGVLSRWLGSRAVLVARAALVAVAAVAFSVASAAGASAAPIWNVQSQAYPTAFQEGDGPDNDAYYISLENIGDSTSSGTITLEDHLPAGIETSAAAEVDAGEARGVGGSTREWDCPGAAAGQNVVKCTVTFPSAPDGVEPITAPYNTEPETTAAEVVRLVIPVQVVSGASGMLTNTVEVSGGGALPATVNTANPVDISTPQSFGSSFFSFRAIGPAGEPFTQAGGHPYAVVTNLMFDQEIDPGAVEAASKNLYQNAYKSEEPKTLLAELPLGLIGDPQATPRCSQRVFAEREGTNESVCPPDTRVGVVSILRNGKEVGFQLFNLAPLPGHAAEFGFYFSANVPVVLYGDVVHSERGYVLRLSTLAPQVGLKGVSLTFFGDPAKAFSAAFSTQEAAEAKQTAFLTDPVDCDAGETARTLQLHTDTWTNPGEGDPFEADFSDPAWVPSTAILPSVTGCEVLSFDPSLSFQPASAGEEGSSLVDTPSGYNVKLSVPQSEEYSELATPVLKTAMVTLPAGLSVSPSAANGLAACATTGPEGINLESDEPGKCPLGSQLGSVKITTPLLEEALEGNVFLGQPECSPCSEADASEGKTFRLFIEVHSEKLGITIKLPGSVRANPVTGQLTAEFEENPQLPFSDLELKFKDGTRAPLANPQSCGTYTTSSTLAAWSEPQTAAVVSPSSFAIGGCGSSLPFAPTLTAGTASPAAGAYSPLAVSFARGDGEQDLGGISVTTPPGLLGKIAGIPRCAEAQANAGTCAAASQIGVATVSAGPGSDPYTINGGKVYLTEPYGGQPFGLSIAVPAEAGPFKLAGNTGTGLEVVRASIAVNPTTAALTITSNPLPQIIDGVPLRLRTVDVDVDRPDFTFNATNCASQSITATLTGEHPIGSGEADKTSSASAAYAAGGCASLPFKPSFSAVTHGHHTRKGGEYLQVSITSGGGQANIAKVHTTLPIKLPVRESTLKDACPEAQFAANPAGCPEGSMVGTATAYTPVLSSALKGPAIFVSHAGAAFPDLDLVLQGEGVTEVLTGDTDIVKGITTSTFKSIPDVPISRFELTLPTGRHSLLAGEGNFCEKTLSMPTTITGQNGAVVEQDTKIKVTGCKTTSKPTLKLERTKAKANTLQVTLKTSAKGRVRISGPGLKTTTKKLTAGVHKLEVKLTNAGRTKRRKVKLRAKLTVGKRSASKTTRVKL